jgi:hypothetical protein
MKQTTLTLTQLQKELLLDLVEKDIITIEDNHWLQYRSQMLSALRSIVKQLDPESKFATKGNK